jgi:ketosteroid isomerase-like protein
MYKHVLLLVLTLFAGSVTAEEEPDHAIHEELRQILRGLEQAINTQQYTDLAQYFHQHMRVTTINQEVISSPDEIAPYFNRWFGPGGYLKKLNIVLHADATTDLYGDKTFGIVRGSGDEDYILANGRAFAMKTRWTATVIKDTDGKWRILTLHIGTNFLDNPVLGVAEASIMQFAIGGTVVGIVVGGLLGFLLGRRKRKS